MLSARLSALFGADRGGIVKDVLSGKERILSLADVSQYPCRNLSACNFAALNFARVAFKHIRCSRGNIGRFLNGITERHVLEDIVSPCEQLTGENNIQLEEMYRIPLFETSLSHVATKHGPPSVIQLKQSLRQMQLHASPVSALVVSRNTRTSVCLKLRDRKDVFLVLDFAPATEHDQGSTFSLVVSTSLEQTAARLSGVSPVDNRLVTRDKQWQAQLFTSCAISLFTPGEDVVLSSEEESRAIEGSIGLLQVMAEIYDQRGDRHRNRPETRASAVRRQSKQRMPPNVRRDVSTRRRPPDRVVSRRSLGEGSTNPRLPEIGLATITPYEQTKRYCRIFFSEDSPPPSSSPSISVSVSVEEPNDEAWFECLVCFEEIHEDEGVHVLPCAHGFCRGCLASYVCSKIEERRFPVFCPLCMTERSNASPSVISGTLVQQLGVSESQYAIWEELEMADLRVRVHCNRCNRSAFVDKEEYEQLAELRCPFPGCHHTWCKNCQQTLAHNGPKHSCDGTEELDYLVKQMGWKYCPKCKTPVQKNGGCNHMTCATPACNTHFCYRCGKLITRNPIPFLVRSAVNTHFKQCSL